jgi:hypothetical protein
LCYWFFFKFHHSILDLLRFDLRGFFIFGFSNQMAWGMCFISQQGSSSFFFWVYFFLSSHNSTLVFLKIWFRDFLYFFYRVILVS